MTVSPISVHDAMLLGGGTHLVKIGYADLNGTASTAKTQTIISAIPAGSRFRFIGGRVVTAFDGGAISELTLKLGYNLTSGTDDDDAYLAATSICGAATEILNTPEEITDVDSSTVDNTYGQQENDVITSLRTKLNLVLKGLGTSHNQAWDLEGVFTSTGANLTALTAGELWLIVAIVDHAKVVDKLSR
jgi:hypothetical protein